MIENDLNLRAIYAELRGRWIASEKGRTSASLTAHLIEQTGRPYTAQSVSQWATGSDRRRPPWRVLLVLLHELDLEIRVAGDGVLRLAPIQRAA